MVDRRSAVAWSLARVVLACGSRVRTDVGMVYLGAVGRSVVFAFSTLLWFGSAPYQCKSDDPATVREDTPGEALWSLCGRFAAEGNDKAARETLDELIERYPSSRLARRAEDERKAEHPCAGVAAEASARRAKASASASGSGAGRDAKP
jgi:hypothetical protein